MVGAAADAADWLTLSAQARRCSPRSGCRSPASWPCWSPAARTGRRRPTPWSRPCSATASAPRCSRRPRSARSTRWRRSGRPAHRRRAGRHRGARGRDVRHRRRRARQRARDAPAQHRPLDDRRRADQPVRAAPARRARPAARRHLVPRRTWSWPTCSAARTPTCTPATCTAWRTTPARRCTCTARTSGPAARSGHVTDVGDDLDDVRARARHAAAYLRGDIDGQ